MITTPLLDDFNRTNAGTLGTNWNDMPVPGLPTHELISNRVGLTATTFRANYWNTQFKADQECWMTVSVKPSTIGNSRLLGRLQNPNTGNENAYYIVVDSLGDWYLEKALGGLGNNTTLQQLGIVGDFQSGWRIGMSICGSLIRCYKDVGSGWVQIGTDQIDSSITGPGYIGIYTGDELNPRYDNFGGGTIRSFPLPGCEVFDNFERADANPLDGNWSYPAQDGAASPKLVSGRVQTANSPPAGVSFFWNKKIYGPDCSAYLEMFDIPTAGPDNYSIYLRCQKVGSATLLGYRTVAGEDVIGLYKQDGASTLLDTAAVSWSPGDAIGIVANGSVIEAWARLDGVWSKKISVMDTTYPGAGHLAAAFSSATQTSAQVNEFGGGEIRDDTPYFNPPIFRSRGG